MSKKKYEVFVSLCERYEVPVEADSEEEAIEIALDLLEDNEINKAKYHVNPDGYEQAYEV